MKHIWSILCKKSIIDADTNNISINESLEEITFHVSLKEELKAELKKNDAENKIDSEFDSMEKAVVRAKNIAGPGDVAIIPDPAYQAYLGGTLLSDATPYVYALRPRTNFLVDLDEIPADVLSRARILYLNYPNNPTAAIAPRDYLERVVEVCRERDILLVYDNAYSEMGFDGYVPPSIFEIDGAREVAIEFHSLSKTYNMTGWRCGWAVAKPEIATALAKVKAFTDTGQYMGIQAAGVAAIESWAEFVPQNVAVFQSRRDAAVAAFRAHGFAADVPRATMYLWMPLPEGIASAAFADRLREDAGVIVLPGSGFGAGGEGFFRISFIQSEARIAVAAQRAGAVLNAMLKELA